MLSNNLTIEINWFEIQNIRELFEKAELILISNNWPTIESRRWRRWSKTGDLHLVWMVTEVLIGRHPEIWIMSGDRPDVRGDRWVCEVFSASGFVQTQNGLVNRLCVWHWILFCVDWSLLNIHLFGGGEFILLLNALLWNARAQRLYIDGHQSHGMNCLCGMLRCSDQGFCWKAKSCGDDQSTACVA